MSQGHRQRAKAAKLKAQERIRDNLLREGYQERDNLIRDNRNAPRERSYPIRTNISAIVCGYSGSGEGSISPKWGYSLGNKARIAKKTY